MEKFILREVMKEDLPKRVEWFNDDSARYMRIDRPLTLEKTEQWFEASKNNPTRKHFAVCDAENGALVGFVGASEIDENEKSASMYIIIGNKAYRGRGNAKIILGLVLEWFFTEYGGETAIATPTMMNIKSVRMIYSCGFKDCPDYKGQIEIDGVTYERGKMILTKEDWKTDFL